MCRIWSSITRAIAIRNTARAFWAMMNTLLTTILFRRRIVPLMMSIGS